MKKPKRIQPTRPNAQVEPRTLNMASPDERIDEVGEESFPASDPPSWTTTIAGPPKGQDAK